MGEYLDALFTRKRRTRAAEALQVSNTLRLDRTEAAGRKEGEPRRIRISIASLVPRLRIAGADPKDPPQYFGILRPGTKDKVQALGGGTTLTTAGRRYLEEHFGATNFEYEEEMDARFVVAEEHEEAVFRFFGNPDPKYFEVSPLREVLEELTMQEHEDHEPVLTEDDVRSITFLAIDTSRQPPPENEAEQIAANPGKRISRRMFYRYEMVIPEHVFKKLQASGLIKFLTDAEVASTNGGRRIGTSEKGLKIADNIYA